MGDVGASRSETEEKSIKFVDSEGRKVLFELSRTGTVNFYVDGRQKMIQVKKIHAEDRTLHLDGKKIMASACLATVPQGQEDLVVRVMELFGQRKLAERKGGDGSELLTVTMISARGLRNADMHSKSDPYCICEIVGKPNTKVKTRAINNCLEPVWNHVAEIVDYQDGDTLYFSVFDKDWFSRDDPLGHCKLDVKQLCNPIFDGEIRLENAGKGIDAYLRVRVATGTEETRAKNRARQQLRDACREGTIRALREAIDAARICELPPAEYSRAQELLQMEEAKEAARRRLAEACARAIIKDLEEAIAAAREVGLGDADCAQAIEVLKLEQLRIVARRQLREALKVGTYAALKAALDTAAEAKLPQDELVEAQARFLQESKKEDARKQLQEACETCTVEALRAAIDTAREVGLEPEEYAKAEDLLIRGEEERRRQRARKQLRDACDVNTRQALEEAIANAKEVKLSPKEPEYERAMAMLKDEDKRDALRAVEVLCRKYEPLVKDLLLGDLEVMRAAREELKQAIFHARTLEVRENADLVQAERMRKQIHNRIEDMKGAIRVFCRARPLSKKEIEGGDHAIVDRFDYMTLEVLEELKGNRPKDIWAAKGTPQPTKKHQFFFNAVFSPGSQDEIFADAADLVQSALDGYNVTIFAYGQTGAGKTYTMFGIPGDPGLAPRTIDEIYGIMERNKLNFEYTVSASIMELYCNELVDLLSKGTKKPVKDDQAFSVKTPANAKHADLTLHHDDSGAVVIAGLTTEPCPAAKDLYKVLEKGNAQRTVAETAMNIDSSRSHLILIVRVQSVNKETKEVLNGKIIVCDLAGSERLKKSQSTGDRQTEATEINKSLTALGDVIQKLTEKSEYVPYRNHKLTQILQDSLGGSAKTLMFVNCSPANSNVEETLMSLNWAARVNNISNTFNGASPAGGGAAGTVPPPKKSPKPSKDGPPGSPRGPPGSPRGPAAAAGSPRGPPSPRGEGS